MMMMMSFMKLGAQKGVIYHRCRRVCCWQKYRAGVIEHTIFATLQQWSTSAVTEECSPLWRLVASGEHESMQFLEMCIGFAA